MEGLTEVLVQIILSIVVLLASFWIFDFICQKKNAPTTHKPISTARSSVASIPVASCTSQVESEGNFPDMSKAGSLHQYLSHLHTTLGPIVQFRWGSQPAVSLCSAQGFQDIKSMFDRPANLFQLIKPLIGDHSIQYANGDEGRARRKLYAPALSVSAIREFYFATFKQVFQQATETTLSSDSPFSVHQLCMTLSLSVAVSCFAGDHGTMGESDAQKFIEAYNIVWPELERHLTGNQSAAGSPEELEYRSSLAWMKETAGVLLEACRSRTKAKEYDSFLSVVAHTDTFDEREDGRVGDLLTMLIGGSHTTGNLVFWALFYILTGPQSYVERIREEARQSSDDSFSIPPFMMNVLNETMRLSVLAPWAARVSDQDTMVLGHCVPAGTPIIAALGVQLLDPATWGPTAGIFDPDRFTVGPRLPEPLSFAPFGFAGGRVCPGKLFALHEASFLLSRLLQHYDLTLAPYDASAVAPRFGLVTSPQGEILARAKKRQ